MRIAIIGAGNVGKALATGWLRAGHEVTFGATDPGSPRAAALAAAYPASRVAGNADAVAGAEVIALAVPWDAVPSALATCGEFEGRVLLDATNPLAIGEAGLRLATGFSDSGGETVARLARGARVVKTMNQVGFAIMADTAGFPVPPVMFVAGDDDGSKEIASRLVSDLGFEVLDAGPLSQSRLLEPYAMLWIDQVVNRGADPMSAFGFMKKVDGS